MGGTGHGTGKLSMWVSSSLGAEARPRRVGRRVAEASAENARMCRRDLGQPLSWASKTVAMQCCLRRAACMES